MSEPRYVQHISGQGARWRLFAEFQDTWDTTTENDRVILRLPKSEYRLCEPPERWVDVTEKITIPLDQNCGYRCFIMADERGVLCKPEEYRLRKVQMCGKEVFDRGHFHDMRWAFIVERKEPAP